MQELVPFSSSLLEVHSVSSLLSDNTRRFRLPSDRRLLVTLKPEVLGSTLAIFLVRGIFMLENKTRMQQERALVKSTIGKVFRLQNLNLEDSKMKKFGGPTEFAAHSPSAEKL